MIKFHTRQVSQFLEVKIEIESFTYDAGLLGETERLDLAKELISVSEDLLNKYDQSDQIEALENIRESL